MALDAWRDKAIYFILIDRFFNGDKSNDDFGKGEFNPNDEDCFHGGDLKGVQAKLPHIKKLGFDAIWITPPVHNQWVNPYIKTRGYHGYWAWDFTQVDPHFGTLEDYRALVVEAHKLGLKVIQDIVVNHTGNFFTVDAKGYDPEHPEKNWKSLGEPPNDPVFRMNDPNNAEHRKAAVYNFTPNISDFKDRSQTLGWSMGDLDDVNLHSEAAVRRMKEIYRFWIDAVGVDAFRVDTVYYTPEDFYERFLYDPAPDAGVKRHAQKNRIRDFFVFGEVWSYDYRAINRYLKDGSKRRLDAAVDLPLNEALTQVFYRKLSTDRLEKALTAKRPNRSLWVNFLDNHDVERMHSRATPAAVRQSLVALYTLPGIPCVTYGTEAGFKLARQHMFREEDFREDAPYAVFLRELNALRRAHPVLSRGDCRVDRTASGCGLVSWIRSSPEETCLAVFNTAPDPMFYALPWRGADCKVLSSSESLETVGDDLLLPPESYLLLSCPTDKAKDTREEAAPSLRRPRRRVLKGRERLEFSAGPSVSGGQLSLLVDDDWERRFAVAEPGSGSFDLDTAALGNGRHQLRLLSHSTAGVHRLSAPVAVSVRNPYRRLARAAVREQDKGGPERKVHPPGDPSYGRQLSMEQAACYTSGKDLRLVLTMAEVTNAWNPPHGYDHVYFSVFFDFPGQRGQRFFPKLDYAREDFEFNAGFLLYGWDSRSFGAKDSSPAGYGAPLVGEVQESVNLEKRTIAFTFSSRFFASLKSFEGVKVFVSTWDGYLGEFRSIGAAPEDWNFYTLDGQPGAQLPKVYDHVVITL